MRTASTSAKKFRLRHAIGLFILLLLVVVIAARLYLPVWLKDYVNKTLNGIDGYRGSVQEIHVHLYRGAYSIEGLRLDRVNAGVPVPFLSIADTDLSLQWGALFDGRVVSDVHLHQPVVNFAVGKSGTEQYGKETNWNDPIKKLMPIDINLVEIKNGKIAYRDFGSSPPVNIYITSINGTLNDLRNTEEKGVALPSTIDMTAKSIGGGNMAVKGRLNVLTRLIDMDLDAKLENAALSAFNSFSDAYAAIHFKDGTMDLYSEIAVKDGQVTGYVKPIIRHLSVDKVPKNSNPLEVIWATVASVLLEIFQNQPHDQFATKVPLSGSVEDIQTAFWPTLGGIFRNAFVEAFSKGTDGEIQFGKDGKEIEKKKPAADKPADASLVPHLGK
jgi:hypothetical protein